MSRQLILMIEDENAIRDMVKFALESEEFQIIEATNTSEADQQLAQHLPHLILLDWMLPGGSGINYIKKLRSNPRTQHIPVIMLTARAEEHNKITGLELGADDYITKPFSIRELIARIKTILRRGMLVSVNNQIILKDLIMDLNTKQVTIRQLPLPLTPNEYRLLHFFLTHANRVYSRQQLLDQVWPHQMDITERTVDAQVRRLRARLKPCDYDKLIQTVRGSGYQFCGEKK